MRRIALLFLLSAPLFAHHGTGGVYDMSKSITLKGTVTMFNFVNPHVLIYFDVGGKDGAVWNSLHAEREDICEALLAPSQAHQRYELLQARLRSIDDALDRLMSKNESELGGSDSRSEIIIENLNSFDTILVRTHNSDYRILLLDPKTGRALVEGGSYLLEPSDGLIKGSALPGSAFNAGAICVGGRLEMWVNEKVLLTSPIKSVEVTLPENSHRRTAVKNISHATAQRRKENLQKRGSALRLCAVA